MYSILEDSVPIHPGGTDDSTSGMKYVFCPECGRQISRSGRGTRSEQPCPKCGADLGIEVDAAGKVHVGVLRSTENGTCNQITPKNRRKAGPRATSA